MRAAPCCRVSSAEQSEKGVSLEAQEARLRASCAAKGLRVVIVVREGGVSGGVDLADRAGGRRLLELIAQRRVTDVVTTKLDRLFRDAADALGRSKEWDRRDVNLHMLDLSIDARSPMGRIFHAISAVYAEAERTQIKERTRAALEHLRRAGRSYNRTPYGYRVEARDNPDPRRPPTRHLVEVPEEQAVIAEIRRSCSEGAPMLRIADRLNRRGVRGKDGGRFHASTIRAILRNDLHGEVLWRRRVARRHADDDLHEEIFEVDAG